MMRTKNATSLVCVVGATFCGLTGTAAGQCDVFGPNLVLNPGFENGDVTSGCPNPCGTSCNFTLENWIREGSLIQTDLKRNTVDSPCDPDYFNPAGGELFVELQGSVSCNNSNNNGGFSQVIPTEIGKQYEISLEVFIDEYDEMLVQADDQTFITISVFENPVREWVRVSATFIAVSNETALRIISVGTPNAPDCLEADYAAIDNVELREVLECQVCEADLDGNGQLDFFDISGFLVFYQLGDITVDFTGDGQLNFFDVSAFLNAFTAGCP